MADDKIDRDLLEFSQSLVSMADRVAAGDALPYEEVQAEVDALVALLDSAPAEKHPQIMALIKQYQELLRRLLH